MRKQIKILFFPLVVILIFTGAMLCNAQVSQEWAARYHFYSDDQAKDIAVDDSGNVYVTGRSEASSPGGAKPDYATIKYNSAGVMQWAQRYNGPGNDFDAASFIAVDDSCNVYVTGTSNRVQYPGTPDYDIATIKYNSVGVQQWVRHYPGGAATAGLLIDFQGNIYVGGRSAQIGSDYLLIKYNQYGDSLWVRKYDSGGKDNAYDYPFSMAVDDFGNVCMTGSVGGNVSSAPDWATVKWNSQGNFEWVQRYNGPGGGVDYPQSIKVDNSSNVYVTGYVWGNNTTNFATVKYDSSGDQKWVSYYANASALAIAVDDSSNSYVTGANGNILTIKYDPSGSEEWVMSFNGSGNAADIPCCIALDDSANVYITGYASITINNRDYCTIKYNKSGVQQWVMYYGIGPSQAPDDAATALAVDKSGNVYVTGNSFGDYATIKYSQTVGINQISNEVPTEFKLFQNFPNPFNPSTKIKFEISKLGFVKLVVFDIIGREIKTLINSQLKPGIYDANFEGNNLSSGVYYYRMITEDYSEIKKMILVK